MKFLSMLTLGFSFFVSCLNAQDFGLSIGHSACNLTFKNRTIREIIKMFLTPLFALQFPTKKSWI